MLVSQYLGHGIGLRAPHYASVLEDRPRIDWLEVITENFLVEGGNPRRLLQRARELYPIALHGVAMNLGSVDPLDEEYLTRLEVLAREIEPAWISDHVCWNGVHGRRGHDLWPLPWTKETLSLMSARIAYVQGRLGRPILLENPSSYLEFGHSEMSEWEFLGELCRRTGCGLLLDVNNVYVTARNLDFDPYRYIDGLPAHCIGEIHVAGHTDHGTHLLDTHDRSVAEPVWELYAAVLRRTGRVSTLIEWDAKLPPLERLLDEVRAAQAVERRVLGTEVQLAG